MRCAYTRSVSPRSLVRHEAFRSVFLAGDRGITVYLPPGYERAAERRYPVMYLHDGQNLFDPEAAYAKGQHWRVSETVTALIESGRLPPLLVVGIDHAGPERLFEYTPSHDRRRGGGGADDHARFLLDEVKPFIDGKYRTVPDAAATGLGGSSLGGLVSLYVALKHPRAFSRIAVLSPSVWWDRRVILRHVRDARPKPQLRIWLDIGTREGRAHVENTRLLRAGLLQSGWTEGGDLHYEEVAGATHNESAWAERLGRVLVFLFGPARSTRDERFEFFY